MSNPVNHTAAEAIRIRIEMLRNYHLSAIRSGEHRLRMAMAEYALQFSSQQERDAA